jgi:hypothetical protein
MVMKVELNESIEHEVVTLKVSSNVRYWEDAEVNRIEDEHGDLIPCRIGDCWCPEIDIESGRILNWKSGTVASIHYKTCDENICQLINSNGECVFKSDGYVPKIICPSGEGYGDYIIMKVDGSGLIENWDNSWVESLIEDEG